MQIIHALQSWWHDQSWLQIIVFFTGLICVLLAAVNNIWNWPIAVISTCLSVYLFAHAHLYADMLQYTYLTFNNLYGWYYWSRKTGTEVKIPVIRITKKQASVAMLLVLLVTPALGFTLIKFAHFLHYNPPAFPYLDSFCTVLSLIAQLYLSRKILENWLIWIFVDMIYIGIYLSKELQMMSLLSAVYLLIAIFGYFDWKRIYKKQLSES